MKEHPILFSPLMVRALLGGTKTQTRRVVAPATSQIVSSSWDRIDFAHAIPQTDASKLMVPHIEDDGSWHRIWPRWEKGDHLWVKETWQYADWTEDGQPFVRFAADGEVRFCEGAGDGETLVDVWAELSAPENYAIDNKAADRRWRPSIFMYRWASRITVEITDVRVQRLQDVSEEDARAEGAAWLWSDGTGAVVNYSRVWDGINRKRAPWSSNPWVWALTFRQVTP